MALGRPEIETRVCIDDFGPFDCVLDLASRWNGFVSPSFTLDVTRDVSAQTLRMADECGYESVDTIHVIDGRADSRDTVHIIDSDMTRTVNEWGDKEPVKVAVRIPWRSLDRGAKPTISEATPAVRKAARRSKVTGRGAARSIVVKVGWMYLHEGSDTSVRVIEPRRDGRYSIGGWEWAWSTSVWWCACENHTDWHELWCEHCDLHRDNQPASPMQAATWKAGATLRTLAPHATSATVDLYNDDARIISVFAGDTEIDTADDGDTFDTETLGAADEILRQAVDEFGPDALAPAGWEHIPDARTHRLYRIVFPAARP
ncbi:hypothetical protein ACFWR6_06840 [Streptomyces griseus]|uniref:hypothetical protein n=1 Tax=Streptomyces griseus TaxID=1911 RepID=UPI003662EC49